MNQSTTKARIVGKAQAVQDVLPFVTQPEHALPMLGMLAGIRSLAVIRFIRRPCR